MEETGSLAWHHSYTRTARPYCLPSVVRRSRKRRVSLSRANGSSPFHHGAGTFSLPSRGRSQLASPNSRTGKPGSLSPAFLGELGDPIPPHSPHRDSNPSHVTPAYYGAPSGSCLYPSDRVGREKVCHHSAYSTGPCPPTGLVFTSGSRPGGAGGWESDRRRRDRRGETIE